MPGGTSLVRKIGWTLLTGFIGFAGSALLDNVLHVSLADQLIITVVIGGVTLLVQYLADFERRLAESDRLNREAIEILQGSIRRGFESVSEATELMSGIERSAVRHDLLKLLIRRASHITAAAAPLVRVLAASETKRLTETLRSLADGHEVFYDGEDREYLLALTRGVGKSLLATCWATVNAHDVGFGTGFWLSDLGGRYLDLQRAAVRRGVTIRRIFIVESPAPRDNTELGRILAMQRSAGIDVRLLDDGEAAQDGGVSDYLVFDEELCYISTPVTRREVSGAPGQLNTRLILNAEIVDNRLHRFAELWAIAKPVGDPWVLPGTEPFGPA